MPICKYCGKWFRKERKHQKVCKRCLFFVNPMVFIRDYPEDFGYMFKKYKSKFISK